MGVGENWLRTTPTDILLLSPVLKLNISTHYSLIQSTLHSLTQLISSHNISPLLQQFHSSRFLPITTHYSMTLCTDIRSCFRGFIMIQFCLVYHQIVQPSLIKTQYWFFSINIQKFLIFQSYWYSSQFNNLTSCCCTWRTVWTKPLDIWNESHKFCSKHHNDCSIF